MNNYNDKLQNLKDRVVAAPKPALQEVKAVQSKLENEVQLNVWMPKTLLHKLKQKALDNQKTVKQLVNEAVEIFLQTS